MICPECQIENFSTAERCDCGYRFSQQSDNAAIVNELLQMRKALVTIKNMIVASFVLSILGAVIWGLLIGAAAAQSSK
jgi:hypothetical protein